MPRPAALAPLALILTAGLAFSPTCLASPCADRIDALSKRVQSASTQAISASTAGQAAAAKRGGEGVTGTQGQRQGEKANEAPQAPPEKSAQAGEGADAAQQAKVALDEARTADAKGDAAGCEAAAGRAEERLKAVP